MGKNTTIAIYILAMVATVVALDLIFFRNRFWERLISNLGTVLLFVAFYLRFLK
jgi:hypothetical protein